MPIFLSYVIANDLSASACDAMRRNVEVNGLGSTPEEPPNDDVLSARKPSEPSQAKVRINEGDAWYQCSTFNSW